VFCPPSPQKNIRYKKRREEEGRKRGQTRDRPERIYYSVAAQPPFFLPRRPSHWFQHKREVEGGKGEEKKEGREGRDHVAGSAGVLRFQRTQSSPNQALPRLLPCSFMKKERGKGKGGEEGKGTVAGRSPLCPLQHFSLTHPPPPQTFIGVRGEKGGGASLHPGHSLNRAIFLVMLPLTERGRERGIRVENLFSDLLITPPRKRKGGRKKKGDEKEEAQTAFCLAD